MGGLESDLTALAMDCEKGSSCSVNSFESESIQSVGIREKRGLLLVMLLPCVRLHLQ